MQMPDYIPGSKWLFVLWIVSAVVWSALEGDPLRARLLGLLTTLVALAYLFQRTMAGRRVSSGLGLLIMGLLGIALGAGSVLMTLFLMVVKTGLHAHGPEFTPAEVTAVWEQLSLWSVVGLAVGIGVGLLLLARQNPADQDEGAVTRK